MNYQPRPISTDHIKIPRGLERLQERLAQNAHDLWATQRIKDGWTYGPARDDTQRQNPCLVPYSDLPESEKVYDRQNAMETLRAIRAYDYEIQPKHRGYQVTFHSTSTCSASPHQIFGGDSGVFPLVISFSGHRDLRTQDVPQLRKMINQWLKLLEQCWKKLHKNHSQTPPIYIFSGMADGADQLVAETVYEWNSPLIKMISVFPMPRKFYEQDFDTPEALDRFRSLVDKSTCVIEIPPCSPDFEANFQCASSETLQILKQRQYESLAFYLATRSTVMFVMLNNDAELRESPQIGGTEDAVMIKLNMRRLMSQTGGDLLDFSGVGPVVQLITPRKTDETLPNNAFDWMMRTRDNPNSHPVKIGQIFRTNSSLLPILRQIAEINRGILENQHKQSLNTSILTSESFLFPKSTDPELSYLSKRFAICDALSSFFQKKNHWWLCFYVIVLTFITSLFTISIYAPYIHANASGLIYGINAGYSLLALTLIVCYFFRRVLWIYSHKLHHAYRAIAEGVRVQVYWHIAGVNIPVSEYYQNHLIGDLDGVRAILQTIMIPVKAKESESVHVEDIHQVDQFWVHDQCHYYHKNQNTLQNKAIFWECLKQDWIMLLIAVWAAIKIWNSWFV